MDDTASPLEERPFAHELGDVLHSAVEQTRAETPPAHSLARSLKRTRRLGPGRANPWLRYHRAATAAAVAAVLFLAFALLLICWQYEPGNAPQSAGPGGSFDRAARRWCGRRRRVRGSRPEGLAGTAQPNSPSRTPHIIRPRRFPLNVDATAYQDVRRTARGKTLAGRRRGARDRLVNAFTYSYPEPAKGEAVSLTLDLARCPWNPAKDRANWFARPSDAAVLGAEVLVSFNPRRVAAYRLIGYEGRRDRDSDAVGETLGAGQAVTALYEIVPPDDTDKGEWLTVKMRYEGVNGRLSRTLTGEAKKLAEASADFRFAAAAAEFGLLLRESKHRGDATYDGVRVVGRDSLGADLDGRRAEFLAMVDAADKLQAARKLVRHVSGFSRGFRQPASSS